MKEVRIPKLGMSTVEVDVLRVLVTVGQRVEVGDPLLEIEGEKTALEVEADVGGRVAEVLVEDEDIRNVGDVVVRIEEDGSQ